MLLPVVNMNSQFFLSAPGLVSTCTSMFNPFKPLIAAAPPWFAPIQDQLNAMDNRLNTVENRLKIVSFFALIE